MSRASVRQMGNLFVYQIGDTFAFLKDTNIEFSAHRIPRQELGLEHLLLMNDGTIQGIVKSGTSVVTYTFFDPSKRA